MDPRSRKIENINISPLFQRFSMPYFYFHSTWVIFVYTYHANELQHALIKNSVRWRLIEMTDVIGPELKYPNVFERHHKYFEIS